MSDNIDDIIIPILRKLQTDMGELKERIDLGFKETNTRLVAMEGHMAAFHTTQASHHTTQAAQSGR